MVASLALFISQSLGSLGQSCQSVSLILKAWGEHSGQLYAVMINLLDDVKSVGHDSGIWEPLANQLSVGTEGFDTNDTSVLSALLAGYTLRGMLPRLHLMDSMIL